MVQSMQEEAVQYQAGTGVWHVVPEALGETESEKELVQALHAYLATDQKRAAVVAQVGNPSKTRVPHLDPTPQPALLIKTRVRVTRAER